MIEADPTVKYVPKVSMQQGRGTGSDLAKKKPGHMGRALIDLFYGRRSNITAGAINICDDRSRLREVEVIVHADAHDVDLRMDVVAHLPKAAAAIIPLLVRLT